MKLLDENLHHLATIIKRDIGVDVLRIPGGGAAGGFGAGSVAFFNSQLRMGIETVLDLTNFDAHLQEADLVITGEGKLDSQSLRGKVVIGVARRAKKFGVPVVALVGASERKSPPFMMKAWLAYFRLTPFQSPLKRLKVNPMII